MSNTLIATVVAASVLGPGLSAQQADVPKPPPPPVTMTGCVSTKPATTGQYTFSETDGLREYRLNGKGLRKFAGQRVEVVGGSSGGGLAIKGGLWPAPTGGARGVAAEGQGRIRHASQGSACSRGEGRGCRGEEEARG